MKLIVFIILFISNIFAYGQSLKVGVLQFAPPFSSKSDTTNHYYGFVVDLMNVICQRLNYKCEFVPIPASGEFDALDKGVLDVTFTPSPITASLLSDKYIFSLPYLASHGQFLALESDPVHSTADIHDKKIGFFKFNFAESEILNKYSTNNKFVEFTDPAELLNALLAKNIDLILINHYAAKYMVNISESKVKLVGDKIPIGSGYGIITLKRNIVLINKINNILLDMEKDGSYLKVFNEYFGSNSKLQ
ncbi:transporter substrate-binding domain-containing protein [Legionella maioricensis]|uniref:Transporter substrate-binding domain-containing protein n=1 Tax=Legionella maioricensis TaxID=2896528 RepID=A0A9X2D265_9GAMM|nr:transporter substrate-binding domain-containing protein [Legionella maioricensis]MCL9684843.1 transporter substrate-binding domain-containing protein [Legionella maioricensis]MCL9688523.1 transporter substrate-binding domain-containing protein [Legionella maioricensis]